MLLVHCIRRADSRAACTAGKSRATSTPMIAMTTNNSTSVKPRAFGCRCNIELTLKYLGRPIVRKNQPLHKVRTRPAPVALKHLSSGDTLQHRFRTQFNDAHWQNGTDY